MLEAAGFVESRLEKASTTCMDLLDLTLSDDFLVTFKKASKTYKDALQHLMHDLHMKQQSGTVVYCGRTISRDGNHIKVTQAKSTLSLECMSIDLASRTLESALTSAEILIPKRVGTVVVIGTVVVVGTAVSARTVCWCLWRLRN